MADATQPCATGYIKWIYDMFADCVVTSKDKWSFYIGLFSTCVWIVSAMPQIYVNYKSKKVDGISPFLFSFLVLGDTLSFIGNIITGGLATQIFTSVVYIILDGTMFIQYLYYRSPSKVNSEDESKLDNDGVSLAPAFAAVAAAAFDISLPYKGSNLVGTIFGWISGIVYISSRIPQVKLNCKNHFVANLSPFYFVCAVIGNTTYLLSLGIRSLDAQFLWKQAPWILGALGPLFCDITTLLQMKIYGFSTVSLFQDIPKDKDVDDDMHPEGDGRDVNEL